jgi:hypothetical protein
MLLENALTFSDFSNGQGGHRKKELRSAQSMQELGRNYKIATAQA